MKRSIRFLLTISACVAAFCAGQGVLRAQGPGRWWLYNPSVIYFPLEIAISKAMNGESVPVSKATVATAISLGICRNPIFYRDGVPYYVGFVGPYISGGPVSPQYYVVQFIPKDSDHALGKRFPSTPPGSGGVVVQKGDRLSSPPVDIFPQFFAPPRTKGPDGEEAKKEAPKQRPREDLPEDKNATETVVQLVERRQRQIELQEFLKQYELEQRKKEIAALAEPPIEFVAIVAAVPPREVQTPLEPKREVTPPAKEVGRIDHSTSESAEMPSLSADRSVGLPIYAKFGLGFLVAVLGIAGLVVGVWYFGRGIYDNLEYL